MGKRFVMKIDDDDEVSLLTTAAAATPSCTNMCGKIPGSSRCYDYTDDAPAVDKRSGSSVEIVDADTKGE